MLIFVYIRMMIVIGLRLEGFPVCSIDKKRQTKSTLC